jgi:hypothetical protein
MFKIFRISKKLLTDYLPIIKDWLKFDRPLDLTGAPERTRTTSRATAHQILEKARINIR